MKHLLSIALLCLVLNSSYGQKFRFEATKSKKTVAIGERFTITYSANGKFGNISFPEFKNFRIISGPRYSSMSTSTNWNTPQVVQSYSYVLMAKKEGTFIIPPATVKSGGKKYSSNKLTIKVIKSRPKSDPNDITSDNIFVEAKTRKRTVFVGEQMGVVYTVYFNVNLGDNYIAEVPSFNGFWKEELSKTEPPTKYKSAVQDVEYTAADLRKVVLIPQRAGKLVLDPLQFNVKLRTLNARRTRWINEEYEILSVPVSITVKPLPEKGKPASFNGVVGRYSLTTEIDKKSLKANEVVTIRMKIKGSGNLKLIDAPVLDIPPDIEAFEPKISNNLTVNLKGVSGSRIFEYVLIPRHAGEYKIPPIEFSYFDPDKRKYVTHKSPEYILSVSKGDDLSATTLSTINKENVKFIGSDIRFIVDGPFLLVDKGTHFFMSNVFYIAFASPVMLLLLLLGFRRRHIERNKDVVQVRRRGANRMAQKSLSRSKAFIDQDSSQFYQEVLKGLWGYLGMKLNVDVADLSKESIQDSLAAKSVSSETIHEMLAVLDICEFAQYAPEGQDGGMQNVYNKASEVISKIENEIS